MCQHVFPQSRQMTIYNDAQCGQAETSIGAIWCHNITISIADHCTKATLVNRTLQSNLRVYVEYRSCCRAGLAPGWDSDAWLQHASQDDLPVFNKPSSATHKNQKTHSLQDIRSVFFLLMSFRSPFARKKEKYIQYHDKTWTKAKRCNRLFNFVFSAHLVNIPLESKNNLELEQPEQLSESPKNKQT